MVQAEFNTDTKQLVQADGADIWIFGYGSIVHKQGFKYSERVAPAYILGYRRVWWQGSTDHRGTPEAPGRTVTLEKMPGNRLWGVAFRLAGSPAEQAAALAQLEWREKQYDVRRLVNVYRPHDPYDQPAVRDVLVYIASPDTTKNVNYLGPASEEALARQIATAVGPSGRNDEYLYKLAAAMREMGVEDEELFALEARVRSLQAAATETAAAAAGDTTAALPRAQELAGPCTAAAADLPQGIAAQAAALLASATSAAAAELTATAAAAAAEIAAEDALPGHGVLFEPGPQEVAVQTGGW